VPLPESEEYEAIERLKNEITVLRQRRRGLPEILASDEDQRWIVTELFPEGTLEGNIFKYQGKAVPALCAFRSLVATVASLHSEGYVHRDIKPANVFVRNEHELVLGDFGIVYMPSDVERLTRTNERVGPRDYMPQWADLGERLEKVHSNFDVYMLGKLLWCMIAGRLKLPREYHRRAAFDLSRIFPNDVHMHLVNAMLDKCIVEEPILGLQSAQELLKVVDENLAAIEQRIPLVEPSGRVALPCQVCGKGSYSDELSRGTIRLQAYTPDNRGAQIVSLRLFVCNVCTHRVFFAPTYPDEAATRNWTPWMQGS
jgi:serine/threonine protein kinase